MDSLTYYAPDGAFGIHLVGNAPVRKFSELSARTQNGFTTVLVGAPEAKEGVQQVGYLLRANLDKANTSDQKMVADCLAGCVSNMFGTRKQRPVFCSSEREVHRKLFGGE